jgi:hypothetical protein
MTMASSSANNKAILNKKLSRLLGFQDGAADVLEHLLTIESSKVNIIPVI